jgi:predicted aspartyl protease
MKPARAALLLIASGAAAAAAAATGEPATAAAPAANLAVPSAPAVEVAAPVVPAAPAPQTEELQEVIIRAMEARYASPTRRDRIGRIWAPVMINGKGPFRLVLDTGSTNSAVMESVALELGLDLKSEPQTRLLGVTGTALVSTVRIDSMVAGDLQLGGQRLPIVIDALGGAEGVLGTKGLTDMRVHIDFRGDQILITRSRAQRAPPGFSTVPLDLTRNRLPLMDAMMDGVHVKAIVDTGGQASIGNVALRDALLRHRKSLKVSRDEITGATADVQYGEGYPAPPIDIGPLRIRNAHITFGDMKIFEHWRLLDVPALLIGMDTLGQFDTLIMDYKLSEMQFRLPALPSVSLR